MYPHREYVNLRVNYGTDGKITPLSIKWRDGRVFEIDKVLDVRRAASEAGGMGVRYTIMIRDRRRYLFYEDVVADAGRLRWFVESTTV